MYNLKIYKKAKETLDFLKLQNNLELKNIISSLDEIKDNWLNWNNIKNIWDNIFRKRTWRWRILFTVDDFFHIWIIDIEKDTKKDYKKWKEYIISKLKWNL